MAGLRFCLVTAEYRRVEVRAHLWHMLVWPYTSEGYVAGGEETSTLGTVGPARVFVLQPIAWREPSVRLPSASIGGGSAVTL
jgi:hypothetical protein